MATGAGRLYKGFLLFLLLGIFLELAALVSVLRGESDPDGNIAVVEVVGEIVDPRGVVEKLKKFEKNEKVKAVVLRVNSPGGAVGASQEIHDEVVRLKAKKKIVVSMGDVAASGGYYVSCPANAIVALPATLTGSIGVLGGKFVVNGLLDRIGLSTGAVQQGEHARMWSARRGFDEAERDRLDAELDAIYTAFVAKVAAGRGRAVAEIEPLARGRVWTGRDAYDRGLVDELGGLRDAARTARRLAGLPVDAPLVPALHLPLIARLSQPRNSDDPRALMSTALPTTTDLRALVGPMSGVQLRMPDIRLR